jgi:enoyl-CoA hydratase/carnithine racemase
MAEACDHVWIRSGVVLNVHYQTMGLYGSEYWTYVLPRRVGSENARRPTQGCMPTLAREAQNMGLADLVLPEQWSDCRHEVERYCIELSGVGSEKALAARRWRVRVTNDTSRCRPIATKSCVICIARSTIQAAAITKRDGISFTSEQRRKCRHELRRIGIR